MKNGAKNPAAVALGALGGRVNAQRHGREHFVRLGKMGGSVNRLLQRLGTEEIRRRVKREGACPACGFPPSVHAEIICEP